MNDLTRGDGECGTDRQDLPRPATSARATLKTTVEETRVPCPVCAGSGQEFMSGGSNTSDTLSCRRCGGAGQVLTQTVTRREEFNLDDLVAAVSRRLLQHVQSPLHVTLFGTPTDVRVDAIGQPLGDPPVVRQGTPTAGEGSN